MSDIRVTYVGHSTLLIEIDGVRLLTDPVLRRRVMHLARLVDLPALGAEPVDAVLISHLHWDHLDLPSLRKLGRDTLLIVPRGAGGYLAKQGFRNINELERHEIVELGSVRITGTYAEHSGERTPFFGPRVESLGFIIKGSQEIYFAGDTDIFPGMKDLGDDLDVALLPVWGYGPTLGAGHLDPYRAAQSLQHLAPRHAIPIHWGTYAPIGMTWMQLPFFSQPPRAFARHASTMAPDVDVQILQPGESFKSTLYVS